MNPVYTPGDVIIPVPINGIIKYYDQTTNTWFDQNPELYLNPVDAISQKNNLLIYIIIGIIVFGLIIQ